MDIFAQNYKELQRYSETLARKSRFGNTGLSDDILHHAWFMLKEQESRLLEIGFPITYETCKRFVRYSSLRHLTASYTQEINLCKPYRDSITVIDKLEDFYHPRTSPINGYITNDLIESFNKLKVKDRTKQIFKLKLEGFNNVEITAKLDLDKKTVDAHIKKIKEITSKLWS